MKLSLSDFFSSHVDFISREEEGSSVTTGNANQTNTFR